MKIVNDYNSAKKYPFFVYDYFENMPWVVILDYDPANDVLIVGSHMPELAFPYDAQGLWYPILISSSVTGHDLQRFLDSPNTRALYERLKNGFSIDDIDDHRIGKLDEDAQTAYDGLWTKACQIRTDEVGIENKHLYEEYA